MLDLEERVNRVHNPDVKPLVRDALRSYNTGAARACSILTWTAVCTDLIDKVRILKEDGEAQARGLADRVEGAQGGIDRPDIDAMLTVERDILKVAAELELIDATDQHLLERLRTDRHLCAHPSPRPSSCAPCAVHFGGKAPGGPAAGSPRRAFAFPGAESLKGRTPQLYVVTL